MEKQVKHMRIVHLSCVAPPEIGGIGQAAYDEVVGLRAKGVDAVLYSTRDVVRHVLPADQAPTAEEIPYIYRLPTYIRVGNASIVKDLSSATRGADIIHLHYPWYGVAERLLWRKPATPVVVTFHMDAQSSDWRERFFCLQRKLLQPRLLRNASKIIVTSRDYAEHSSIAPYLSELAHKLVELPFGLDTEWFSPEQVAASSHSEVKQILFVGGLDRAHTFKGLDVLIEAMSVLDKDTHLTIIGDGDLRSLYEVRCASLGLKDRIRFLGRVNTQVLRDSYRQADVLAFPSTSSAEAFGLVALEAQACGTPVVASNLPGVRTVVKDGETGYLVPPGSKDELVNGLQRILQDDGLRQALAKGARAHVLAHYAKTRHIDGLMQVYQSVCI